jgi:hypothetical protein
VSKVEEFEIDGEKVVAKVKEIVAAGNVRRISIKNEDGRTLIDVPLTAGVVVGVLAPALAAVGAAAALVTKCRIAIERVEPVGEGE